MSRRDMETAYEVLCRWMRGEGKLATAARYRVYQLWQSIVGDRVSRHTRVLGVDGTTLIVAASSSAWANELSFMKEHLLRKINAALPEAGFRDIRFTVRSLRPTQATANAEASQHPTISASAVPDPDLTWETQHGPETQLGSVIPDPRLRTAFLACYTRLLARERRLLARGLTRCPRCGAITDPRRACPYCTTRDERRAYLRAWALLARSPSPTWSQVCAEAGKAHPSVLMAARSQIEYMLTRSIRWLRAQRRRDPASRQALKECIRKLACLRAGRPVDDSERELLRQILGEKYYKLLEEATQG